MSEYLILYKNQITGVIRKIDPCIICGENEEGLSVNRRHICFQCWSSIYNGDGINEEAKTQEAHPYDVENM